MEQLTFDQYATEVQAAIKLCECGCGEPTRIAVNNHRGYGYVKGQPMRFLRGHSQRGSRKPAPPVPDIDFQPLRTELMPRPENRAWIYAFWNTDREVLYVGKVVRFHYSGRFDEHSHRMSWWDEVAFVSAQEVPVDDVAEAECLAIRELQPKYNLKGNCHEPFAEGAICSTGIIKTPCASSRPRWC